MSPQQNKRLSIKPAPSEVSRTDSDMSQIGMGPLKAEPSQNRRRMSKRLSVSQARRLSRISRHSEASHETESELSQIGMGHDSELSPSEGSRGRDSMVTHTGSSPDEESVVSLQDQGDESESPGSEGGFENKKESVAGWIKSKKLEITKARYTKSDIDWDQYLKGSNLRTYDLLGPPVPRVPYLLWMEAGRLPPLLNVNPENSGGEGGVGIDRDYNGSLWRSFRHQYGVVTRTAKDCVSDAFAAMYPIRVPAPSRVGDDTITRYLSQSSRIKNPDLRQDKVMRSEHVDSEFRRLREKSQARALTPFSEPTWPRDSVAVGFGTSPEARRSSMLTDAPRFSVKQMRAAVARQTLFKSGKGKLENEGRTKLKTYNEADEEGGGDNKMIDVFGRKITRVSHSMAQIWQQRMLDKAKALEYKWRDESEWPFGGHPDDIPHRVKPHPFRISQTEKIRKGSSEVRRRRREEGKRAVDDYETDEILVLNLKCVTK